MDRQRKKEHQHRQTQAERRWSLLCDGEGHPKVHLKVHQQSVPLYPRQGWERKGSGIGHGRIPRQCYPR